ncbi:pseudouridylate synthase 1 homolog [Tribolium castaneum]|uniref:Pseudouridylate synthase 1 homolog n=1 Tax=Tribolium castaneum TaxID=7070 RepID=D6WB40_TRICA|nr:PREDICTED: tRNA pseudouridine synthase A, mitochondrial [Tribolium castaneum]EEZ98974.2 tRNA pseudouridine synthase A, mitochondrial-like Protein [Tribolium castaneum]|eukprot:XP_008200830.1 PREDICTED: tRNA pseudouridine synthase A, mitochondrial [Tribolium castaneum]
MLQAIRKLIPFYAPSPELPSLPIKMSEVKIVRKPRYDGRVKKRQWEERRSDKGEGLNFHKSKIIKKETEVTGELIEKIKRRKFAVLLGYSGTNYYGMQRNPNTPTIEEEFFKALYKNNYISEENFTQVQTMQFQRAARTDKGVSAARQVVSLKLREDIDISKINEQLPEVIRVFGIRRVTKGFNSKVQCDSRSYTYLLPTVSFTPHDQLMVQKGFRLDDSTLNRINDLLQKYLGTKNFHNFTSKKQATDPSAKRYMKTLICEKPFVKDDVEFALIKIRGQSFMLHQIRKMVGLLIAVVKGYTSEDTLDLAFGMDKVNIPKAPGLGLLLDYVHYERYDNRYGADGVHEKLVWDDVEKEVEEFREKYIFPTIINTEVKDEAMVAWIIRRLSTHKYDDIDDEDDKSDSEQTVNSDNR